METSMKYKFKHHMWASGSLMLTVPLLILLGPVTWLIGVYINRLEAAEEALK